MAIAVIPARYSATRLPGKPLVSLAGKPMIQRVWERASASGKISRVIIATDDERILKAADGIRSGGGHDPFRAPLRHRARRRSRRRKTSDRAKRFS